MHHPLQKAAVSPLLTLSVTHGSVIFGFMYPDSLVLPTYCKTLLQAPICSEIKAAITAELLWIAPSYTEINLLKPVVTFSLFSPRYHLK